MSLIHNKLRSIHSNIRKQFISSLITKIRYETINQRSLSQLTNLIQTPLEQYSVEYLERLLGHVFRDQTNAILHLGNMVIDRYINVEFLESVDWKLGQNEYWTWLINTFTEIGFCTEQMMEYIIQKIINKKSNHSLENALEAIIKCLKNNVAFTLNCLKAKENVFLAIYAHTHDSNQKIYMLSMSLIVTATSQSQDLPLLMKKVLGESRLTRCFMQGLLKVSIQARSFAIQAANNFILSNVILPQIAIKFCNTALLQKQPVKLELSYYFVALAKHAPSSLLQELITEHDLMSVLKQYTAYYKNKYSKEIRKNAEMAGQIIFERMNTESSGIGIRQICRWGTQLMRQQSEDMTMCLEYHN